MCRRTTKPKNNADQLGSRVGQRSVWIKLKRLVLSFGSQQSSISHGNIAKYFISKIAHQELPDELITPNGSHFNSGLFWQVSLIFFHMHTSSNLPPADSSDSFPHSLPSPNVESDVPDSQQSK